MTSSETALVSGSAGIGADGPTANGEWLELELPGILAGLLDSGSISRATATAAQRHVAAGNYEEALAMALDEAFALRGSQSRSD
jgi:hypothetical protein